MQTAEPTTIITPDQDDIRGPEVNRWLVGAVVALTLLCLVLTGVIVGGERVPEPTPDDGALLLRGTSPTQLVDRLISTLETRDADAIAALYAPHAELDVWTSEPYTLRSPWVVHRSGAAAIASVKRPSKDVDRLQRVGPVVRFGDHVVFAYAYREGWVQGWWGGTWHQGITVFDLDGELIANEWDHQISQGIE
jgi:hypothetical protein